MSRTHQNLQSTDDLSPSSKLYHNNKARGFLNPFRIKMSVPRRILLGIKNSAELWYTIYVM